jgi:hypothetical protein
MDINSHGSACKRLGDRVELRFMEKALEHGYEILKPWGDNSAFDVALVTPSSIRRVQVRSTSTFAFGRYRVQATFGANKVAYKKGLIDFLAAYVIPCDVWYIVPAWELGHHKSIYMRPNASADASPWEKFRDAWHLLS